DGDHVLDRKIASYQDIAAERAARIGARVAVLDKKIPDASADEKPKLEAERKALQAELDSLVQAGIAAGGRYDCDDPEISTKTAGDADSIQRCIAVLTGRIQEAKNRSPQGEAPKELNDRLRRLQHTGRLRADR